MYEQIDEYINEYLILTDTFVKKNYKKNKFELIIIKLFLFKIELYQYNSWIYQHIDQYFDFCLVLPVIHKLKVEECSYNIH